MRNFFHYRADWVADGGLIDVLILFNAGRELDTHQLREIVDGEVQNYLRPDQLIVISRAQTIAAALQAIKTEETQTTLLERVGEGCHVELWSFDETGGTDCVEALQKGPRRVEPSLTEIVRRGATKIFNEHKGFVEGSESYHFRNPSGKHTDRFMRLSNILVRQAEITFLALALLSFVPLGTKNAYIDTPALHAVISALNELRKGGEPDAYIAAENFRSYYGVDDYPFTEVDRSVAIISASSSGSLAARLTARGFSADQVIHLLFLGEKKGALQIAVDLAFDKRLNPFGHDPARRTYEKDCALCKQGSMFIELRGDQFDISPPQPLPLVIKQAHAPEALSHQLKRLVGSRCFSSSAMSLHWIDPAALLQHPPYAERLDYFLRRFVPAGAQFCVLADEQSEAWGRAAAEKSGQTFQFVRADRPNEIELSIQNADGPLLVMAAVIGNGRRLLDISRELRTAAPRAPITYIVGFAKPSSVERLRTLRNSLIFSNREAHHAFETIEEMVLPSARRENAWEQELEFLREAPHAWAGRNRDFINQRIAQLENVSAPLIDNLFLANAFTGVLKMRPGFAFWPEGLVTGGEKQADVYTTISSVLQSLRTAPSSAKEALRSGWFRQTLIHPEVFGRFNDGILQASFLRAALPSELDYRSEPELSSQLARLIGRIVEGANLVRGEGAFEFLLALGCSRLRLQKGHYDLALPVAPPNRPLIQALRKTVRTVLGV
ncbi:MAG TPA: hypothetical protein VIT45_11140 [Allosphingosinicella sp.]